MKEQTRFSRPQVIVVTLMAIAMAFAGLLISREARIKKSSVERPKQRVRSVKKEKVVSKIYVHVGGAVLNPGLYKLKSGARAAEALKSAGGLIENGDIDAINLATKLRDGQKIVVPKIRHQLESTSNETVDLSPVDDLININSANQIQLESLNGIGPVLAERIIDWRQSHHGFKTVRQLNSVSGIGPKKYEQLKDDVKTE